MIKMNPNKLGRNDMCYCGSGKKHKRCCLSKEPVTSQALSTISSIDRKKSEQRLLGRAKKHMGDDCPLHVEALELKMSGVILDLADFLLKVAKTKAQYQSAITIACIAWNIAVLGAEHGQKCWDALFSKMDNTIHRQDVHEIINAFIAKKRLKYDEIKRVIVDFELLINKMDIHLTVMCMVPEEEISESKLLT